MAQRRIGQEQLGISADRRQGGASLDAPGVIDGQAIAALLTPLYPAAKGEPAWPPLAMFQAMRLAVWYDRWRGLAKATAHILFTATAYTLKRSVNIPLSVMD